MDAQHGGFDGGPELSVTMVPEQRMRVIALIASCWRDGDLAARFLAEPMVVLGEFGVRVADGIKVVVLEDREDLRHIVLPVEPVFEYDVTDDELGLPTSGNQSHPVQIARELIFLRAALDA